MSWVLWMTCSVRPSTWCSDATGVPETHGWVFPSPHVLAPGTPTRCCSPWPYKDGHNKGQNDMDLTEAEVIKKRWQEYTEELYKKELHDPDNHDGMIIHLEPDILECQVKSALGSITMNRASGGDGIPVELFQILKDDVKAIHSICQQICKTQQQPQDWKRSVFFAIPKKGNVKECSNYHTIALTQC